MLLKQSEAVKRTTELTVTNSKDSNSMVQLHELWQALLDSSSAGSSPMQRLSQHTRDKLLQLYRQATRQTPSLQGALQTLFEQILDASKAADSTNYDNTKFDLATEALLWRANQTFAWSRQQRANHANGELRRASGTLAEHRLDKT